MLDVSAYQLLDPKKIIFQNTSAILGGRAANLILSLISSVLVVRYLGSERFGQYASLYAYLTLFSWLTTFGMEQIVVSESAKQKENTERLLGIATFISSFLSIFATGLAILGSVIFGYANVMQKLLFIAAVDLLLLAPLRLHGVVFQIYLRQWYGAWISIARQSLWVILLWVFIALRVDLPIIILGRLCCSFLEALATFLFARRFIPFRYCLNSFMAQGILKQAWPIALSGVCISIYHRIDQIILHVSAGNQQLGYYAASVNIAELFSIFAIALMSTMLPVLSKIVSQKERFEHYVKICFRYLISFLFGICAVITSNSSLIVRLLYGNKYIKSAPALAILIWSELGVFSGLIICTVLIVRRMQKFILFSTIAGAVINLILNMLLIPKWGILGASWATVVSYNLAGFFIFLLFPATRDLWITGAKESVAPFLIGLFIAIFLSLNKFPQLTSMALAIILYLSGLFIFRVYNKNDLQLFLSMLGKPSR